MLRFERGAVAPAPAAAPPASVDFFGAARAAGEQCMDDRAKKRARGDDGRAHATRGEEDDRAQERHADDSAAEDAEDAEDAEALDLEQAGSGEEDEGVQLFSGGRKSTGGGGGDGSGGMGGSQAAGKAGLKALSEASAREELAVFRRQMRISVAGDEVPAPEGSFEEMRFPKEAGWLRHGIETAGWKEPTPIQMQAVPVMMARRDVLACAPTGSGKTGAFVIPLFALLGGPKRSGIRGLIVAPTRELATQIFQQCQLLRAHSKMECKLLTKATAAAVANEQSSMGKKHDVLVSTPARLVSLLQQRALDLSTVQVVIIDEADKLFEDGFVGQIDEVLAACTHKNLQKALFSATIPPQVEELAKSIMPNPVTVTVGKKVGASTSIIQKLIYCGSEEGKVLAMRQQVAAGLKPPVLVFVQSVDRAKQLFRELVYDGINVDVMHADRTQAQRDQIIAQFRSGAIWVCVCGVCERGVCALFRVCVCVCLVWWWCVKCVSPPPCACVCVWPLPRDCVCVPSSSCPHKTHILTPSDPSSRVGLAMPVEQGSFALNLGLLC
jgi:ATP-dependent RNA helicase DDX52/ROK1